MSTSVSRRSSATGHPTRQQLDELDALLKRMLDLPVNRLEDEAAAPAPPPATLPPTLSPGGRGQGEGATASAPEPMRGPHRPTVARAAEAAGVNYSTAEDEEADLKPRVVADAQAPQAKGPAAPPAPAADSPNAERQEDWVPLTSTWRPSARTWKPLSEAWTQAQAAGRPADPPAVLEEPSLAAETPPSPEPQAEAAAPIPEPAPEPAPVEAAAPSDGLAHAGGPHWALWPLLGFNAAFDVCLMPWGAPGRWLRGRAGRMAIGVVGLLALAAAAALAVADWFGWTG